MIDSKGNPYTDRDSVVEQNQNRRPTSTSLTSARGLRQRNQNGKMHRSKKSTAKLLRDKEKLEPMVQANKKSFFWYGNNNSLFTFLSGLKKNKNVPTGADEEETIRNPNNKMSIWTFPAVLSILVGPFCWFLGHYGYHIQWALFLTIIIIMSMFGLRKSVETKSWLVAKRKAAEKHFSQDDESSEWFNEILQNIWSFYEPILCRDLSEVLLSKLEAMKPSRVYSFEIQKFTMGSQAPPQPLPEMRTEYED